MKLEDWQVQGLKVQEAAVLPYTESLFGDATDEP
jgi:hypothetical protein